VIRVGLAPATRRRGLAGGGADPVTGSRPGMASVDQEGGWVPIRQALLHKAILVDQHRKSSAADLGYASGRYPLG